MISWADDRGSRVAFDVSSASHVVSLNLNYQRVVRARCFLYSYSSTSRRFPLAGYTSQELWQDKSWRISPLLQVFEQRLDVGAYVSSGGHNIGQTLPTEWSNYLLIGGSPVSRTITLANPLDGNFNRYNWNRKTGRNADCPSSCLTLCRIVIQERAVQFVDVFQITSRFLAFKC